MPGSRKISYSALFKFLKEEIDRRYKNKNSDPWRTQDILDQDAQLRAQKDDWFNLRRILTMRECQSVLESFCELRRPLESASEITSFLFSRFNLIEADTLFRMTQVHNCQILGDLISLFQDSIVEENAPDKPQGETPKIKESVRRAQIVKAIMTRGIADFNDREKILALARKLDEAGIPLPVRRGPPTSNWEPKTYFEVASKPKKSFEYERIFGVRDSVLRRDLYKR